MALEPILAPGVFQLQAFGFFDFINIKELRSHFAENVVFITPQELQIRSGENSYIFVYRFGSIVFFNMNSVQIDQENKKLKDKLGARTESPTTETYQIHAGLPHIKVEFEYIELKKITQENLRLISMTVAQSTAMERFELDCDKLLDDTTSFLKTMAIRGKITLSRTKHLFKIIGSTASTRQHIISNLSILDPPDVTWKSKELERIYKELQSNFDIEIRFRTLDKKLALVQDNIELLTDLISKSRFMVLEMLIVILIFIELFIALF